MKAKINNAIGSIEKAIAELKAIENPPEDVLEVISDLGGKVADLEYVKYKRFQEEREGYISIKIP